MPTPPVPSFVDEHRVTIAATRERAWAGLRRHVDASLADRHLDLFRRVLGTEPDAGFAVAEEVPGERLALAGRHRFSIYRLVFELGDADAGSTELSARTYADFPGPHGRIYRMVVIDSRLHVLAMRRMLSSIRRASLE